MVRGTWQPPSNAWFAAKGLTMQRCNQTRTQKPHRRANPTTILHLHFLLELDVLVQCCADQEQQVRAVRTVHLACEPGSDVTTGCVVDADRSEERVSNCGRWRTTHQTQTCHVGGQSYSATNHSQVGSREGGNSRLDRVDRAVSKVRCLQNSRGDVIESIFVKVGEVKRSSQSAIKGL
jgi:hypothetical protein